MSTLWSRRVESDPWVESFLAGEDHVLDLELIPYDCRASIAHARMLHSIGVLNASEFKSLEAELQEIVERVQAGRFSISPGEEDGHTAIENFLTERCGEAGRKIHTGRSRNDQVLTALRLWEKEKLQAILLAIGAYSAALADVCERHGEVAMPGYTHMQRAMPTTLGMWLGSFIEAAVDDTRFVSTAFDSIDQCPLGTAAGFGVPVIDLDREQTARELGFARVQENPMYAQLSRGRLETLVLAACTQVMHALNRLATDLLLFSTQEFGFVSLPASLCTGSSFMPQKKNADVLELVRGSFHVVAGEESKVRTMTAGLLSGYNRDTQLSKGPLMRGIQVTLDCLRATTLVLEGIEIQEEACRAAISDEMYATERAMTLVAGGMPFRDAYRQIAQETAEQRG